MLIILAACGQHGQLGYQNTLPWNNREDMILFKEKTWNQKIVMGRKTFESLPRKLENREIFIVSQSLQGDHVISDLKEFCQKHAHSEEVYYICGGAQIYQQCLPYCKEIWLSYLPYDGLADTYFPVICVYDYDIKPYHKETFTLYHLIKKGELADEHD